MSYLETMPKDKSIQSLEVWNSIITESSSLVTFLTHDSYTDWCRLDHVNIISTITDGKCEDTRISLHELNDFSLIIGRWSINNDGLCLIKQISNWVTELCVAENSAQRLTVHQNWKFLFHGSIHFFSIFSYLIYIISTFIDYLILFL
jgi:hypothetical protein